MSDAPKTLATKEDFELEKLRLERERLALEVALKQRELDQPPRTSWRDILANPLILAVVGGIISIIASIVTTTLNSSADREKAAQTATLNREAEERKAKADRDAVELRARYERDAAAEALQAELIKKFVEGPNVQRIRQNLTFLVDAGLIRSYEDRIRRYLREHPDAAPQVPASGSVTGITSSEGVPVSTLPASDVLRTVANSVGRLAIEQGGRRLPICSAFLIAPQRVLSVGFCPTTNGQIVFEIGGSTFPATILEKQYDNAINELNFLLLGLDQPITAARPLPLSTRPPAVGQALSVVYFLDGDSARANRSPDCRVTAVNAVTFEYGCKTGNGTAGSPILTQDGTRVLGIHMSKKDLEGKIRVGLRADILVPRLATISP